MPLIDANQGFEQIRSNRYDVIIVGAGAAGILLAVKLSALGRRVLVLESGHHNEDPHRQVLNAVQQTGKPLQQAEWGRKRAIGGTTIAWGGQSLPFDELDFRSRDWVANSGWPITAQELAPHYHAANEFMGIDTLDYDDGALALLGRKKITFDAEKIRFHVSKWAPQANFRLLYKREISQHFDLLYNAHVTGLKLQDGLVKSVSLHNFESQSSKISARTVIIAAGGIETVRLLLLHQEQLPASAKNWLGKGFMDHACAEIGRVRSEKPYQLQKLFGTAFAARRKFSMRMSLAARQQSDQQLLNASAGLMFLYRDADPFAALKSLFRGKLSVLPTVLSHAPHFALAAWARLQGFTYKLGAEARLSIMAEQAPWTNSSIALGSELDQFGLKKALIHWQISPATYESVKRLGQLISSEFTALNLGTVELSHSFEHADDPSMPFSDVNHHMGGARMSADPESGVVDSNLAVWGVENLYVSSAAVFPTGSHSNPTLTLLALANRLVEHLVEQRFAELPNPEFTS